MGPISDDVILINMKCHTGLSPRVVTDRTSPHSSLGPASRA